MIIYKCRFTDDEFLSDSFKMKIVDDFFIEVETKKILEKYGIDESKLGANKSAEEEAEEAEDGEVTEYDVIIRHKLKPLPFHKKKDFQVFVKGYLKKISADLVAKGGEDAAKDFEQRAKKAVPALFAKFDNLDFYQGDKESCDEGHVAMLEFREIDGVEKTFFLFFKDGLIAEKY